MKKSILLVASFFISISLFSQTLSNQLLGYQEPYAKMEAQAVDSLGNVYYAGTFKGPLVINNQTVFNGNGGDDVFVVKTNSSGDLIWVKKYGEAGNESGNYLLFHDGALYLSLRIGQTTTIQGNTINAYPAGSVTTAILKLDTSGSILWARRTSLLIDKIIANKNQVFLQGMLQPQTSSSLYLDENLLIEPAFLYRSFFVYLDTSGNYLGNKLIISATNFGNADVFEPSVVSNGKLFYMLSIYGTSVKLGNQTVNFSQLGTFYVLVKTDTSFSDLQYKILNPGHEGYTSNLLNEYAGFSIAPQEDSLYMILGGSSNTSSYKLDGYNVLIGDQNMLLVMDTNFLTKRLKPIGLHRIDGSAFRVSISHIISDSGHYYLRGRLSGNNNAVTIGGIPSMKKEVEILYGLKDSFDINGPSRSFLVRTTKDFNQPTFKWLGYHTPYESPSVIPEFFTVNKNNIYFLHKADNVWNPWIIDTSLHVLKGSMKSNADRGETNNYVKYFSDGSKALVGLAKGKTALDTTTSSNIVINGTKSDLFFVLMNRNEQVQWYKRMYHSFGSARIEKVVARNEKIYLSVVFNLPRNTSNSNYVRIDSNTYFINASFPVNISVLIVFDKSGEFHVIGLNTPFNNSALFDVFKNGDIALVSSLTTMNLAVAGKQFGTSQGLYVARIDLLGNVKDAAKFISSPSTSVSFPTNLIVDTLTDKYNLICSGIFSTGSSNNSITYHNGLTPPVAFSVINPKPASPTSRQYFVLINSSFNSINKSVTIGPLNSYTRTSAILKNRNYLMIGKTNMKDSIYYNSDLMIPDSNSNVFFMIAIDTALNYYKHKIISSGNSSSYGYGFTHITAHGNHVYASGSNNLPIQIDTVNIGHTGLNDAITVQFDSSLIAKKVFRLASIYNETMYGCDLFNDSLVSFAYTSQGTPAFINGRFAARNTGTESPDLDENAYIQTVLLKTGVITSVDEPVRVEGFKLFPNPVLSNMVAVDLGNTEAGRYQWLLYNTEGRLIESNMLIWSPGQTKQIQFSNRLQAGNYVLVIKTGKQQTLKAVKLTIL